LNTADSSIPPRASRAPSSELAVHRPVDTKDRQFCPQLSLAPFAQRPHRGLPHLHKSFLSIPLRLCLAWHLLSPPGPRNCTSHPTLTSRGSSPKGVPPLPKPTPALDILSCRDIKGPDVCSNHFASLVALRGAVLLSLLRSLGTFDVP